MSEAVFNTLLAVAQMCNGHFHGLFITGTSGGINLTLPPSEGHWEAGFEQCATVKKSVEDEQKRRATDESNAQEARDKARLKNALAAIHGEGFAPEPAPAPPKLSPFGGCSYINTGAQP